MNAVILGAGASAGSFADELHAPVATRFGEALAAVEPGWRIAYPSIDGALRHLGNSGSRWSLEAVWSLFDYYAKFREAILPSPAWPAEGAELKKALLSVYGRRCDIAATRIAPGSTLFTLLRDVVRRGDFLVSFNFDTIAENVAERIGIDLRSDVSNQDAIRFAKPHGSTSWILNRNVAPQTVTHQLPDGRPLLSSLVPADVDRGIEPLLLGAVPIKSELIKEVQARFNSLSVFEVVCAQWRLVVEAVRSADVVVVAGYSFPPEDQYGRFLFNEGLRGRSQAVRVEYFEVESKAEEMKGRIHDVFADHVGEVIYRGRVLPSAA